MKRLYLYLLILIFLVTSACGAFNVQMVFRTPTITTTPPPAATGTPILPTETQKSPAVTPTLISVPPIPLPLTAGGTNGNFEGKFEQYSRITYEIKLPANQYLEASISSATQKVAIEVEDPGGKLLITASQNLKSWQGYLPTNGNYHISIVSGNDPAKYYLQVIIPTRINIKSNGSSSSTDKLSPNGMSNYILNAAKGQTMTIKVDSPENDIFLEVYGVSNGQQYLRQVMDKTSFVFNVPATQDYAINLISTRANAESYTAIFDLK